MFKRGKIILGIVMVGLLTSMTVGGVVLAQDSSSGVSLISEPELVGGHVLSILPLKKLFSRVAEILGIDEQQLIDAFKQARQEMIDEAFDKRLGKAVKRSRLTEEQAEEIKKWREARPEYLPLGFLLGLPKSGPAPRGKLSCGIMADEFKCGYLASANVNA